MQFTNICFCRSFDRNLRPLLMFAQLFGIMPLNSSPSCKFSACLLVHTFIVIMLSTLVYYSVGVIEKFDYGKFVEVIFFTNCLAIAVNFVVIGRKMPKLLKSWKKFESDFDGGENFNVHSWKILTVFMTIAILEHFLSKAVDYESASFCFHAHPTKFEAFSRAIIPTFFKVFPYHDLLAVYVILTCFLSTVLWNFSDVFLITIYFVIFIKLKKFNRKIDEMRFKHFDEKFWFKVRLNYFTIHEKIVETNCVISCLVMLSILNDFYFVCNQILGAFKCVRVFEVFEKVYNFLFFFSRPSQSLLQSIYFWFSLLFLVFRTLMVSLSGSMIYQESKVIVNIINDVPSEFYSSEVKTNLFMNILADKSLVIFLL